MAQPVTLSREESLSALSTLTYAENWILNMTSQSASSNALREELLELRRMIARKYNSKDES